MADKMIAQFNRGEHDAAIQEAVRRIDEKPTDPKRYATLATMLIGIKAFDQASQLLVKALGLFPNDAELTYDAGLLAHAQENDQLAVRYFLQLTQGPLQADAQYMLALSYQRMGQAQRALAFALTAHEADRTRLDAALLCAELLLGLGVFEQAAALLRPFAQVQDAKVLFTYGMAETGAGRDGSAWLTKAKALDPKGYQEQAGRVRDIAGFLKVQNHD
ncbi:tetratricopeptide repeat protein [Lacticaseibacillus parakribbianus]|uniref:tetratricopeptide repeat protein n=1 Tax=Lacticaseibacillus parakribbianus TaxID=2970927 RepID=UPI0021CB96FD|nr:tetratricopeptide repeat protein [Lacticaseibacillus parakribbianus]